jgi:hypothetical protein
MGGTVLQCRQIFCRRPLGYLVTVRSPAVGQQIGDAVDEHRGLSAPRTGKEEQRSLSGQHRLPLHGVQSSEGGGDDRPSCLAKTCLFLSVEHIGLLSAVKGQPLSSFHPTIVPKIKGQVNQKAS